MQYSSCASAFTYMCTNCVFEMPYAHVNANVQVNWCLHDVEWEDVLESCKLVSPKLTNCLTQLYILHRSYLTPLRAGPTTALSVLGVGTLIVPSTTYYGHVRLYSATGPR